MVYMDYNSFGNVVYMPFGSYPFVNLDNKIKNGKKSNI